MELVQFLFDFRTKDAVPVLIDVLQRFKDHPEDVQSGKVSGLLLHRVHDTLVSMTGSILPADAPDKWRELWEKDKDSIAIVPRDAAAAKPVTKGGTVSRSFCGIPVQGSRVLFIVDLSGSMNFAMKGGGTGDRKAETRLDFAKKQMHQVIADMPETSRLNFITYNGLPKAEFWNKDLVVATAKSKERAIEFVEKMRADGGTNMWAGLDEGLKMKSLVYGERYATTVDEIFLVSDGAPSVGEVIDPMEILRLVTETNRFSKVRINTIFITSPNERDPRNLSLSPSELMKRMAEQNGGRFVQLKE
jgi:Mg-chelatase subunit ChlD